MLYGKDMIIHLIVGSIKRMLYMKMSQHCPKEYEPLGGDINVKVDLPTYATGVDKSKFAEKVDLFNVKSNADKLDIDKLALVPVDLSKLSNVVKNDVVKKTEHKAKIKNTEYKTPDITNLVTETIINAKINEIKGEIPSTTNLVTTTALTAVEYKIPNVSHLVDKTDYNAKINEIKKKKNTDHNHDKYITTLEFTKLTAENVAPRLAQANLVTKIDFDSKLINVNKKN